MNFNPADACEVLPEGCYSFEIVKAAQELAKSSGAEMLVLTLKCVDAGGRSVAVTDRIVNQPNMLWKLKQLCYEIGLKAKFDNGSVEDTDLIGLGGNVELRIEHDKSGQYPDKNGVKKYGADKNKVFKGDTPATTAFKPADDLDIEPDLIPF